MENIIKTVIEIENAAKDRLAEMKQIQQKYKDDCFIEFKQLKRTGYINIDEKINAYKKEQKKIFDTEVDRIGSNQKKLNQKLINDFESHYDVNLNDLFKKITS
jgi:hypothetical protein